MTFHKHKVLGDTAGIRLKMSAGRPSKPLAGWSTQYRHGRSDAALRNGAASTTAHWPAAVRSTRRTHREGRGKHSSTRWPCRLFHRLASAWRLIRSSEPDDTSGRRSGTAAGASSLGAVRVQLPVSPAPRRTDWREALGLFGSAVVFLPTAGGDECRDGEWLQQRRRSARRPAPIAGNTASLRTGAALVPLLHQRLLRHCRFGDLLVRRPTRG